MSDKVPEYQAYCDICKGGSTWFPLSEEDAKVWREMHFKDQHPDKPMKKTNCRIRRRKVDVEEVFDNPAVGARIEEAFGYQDE